MPAYPSWPFECPNSWKETPVRPVIRSEIEDGYPKVRRRFTKTWYQYQATFRLAWTDYDAFWDFYNTDCQGGAQPFTIKHPVTGASLIVRFGNEPATAAGVDIKPYFDLECVLELQFS